MEPGFVIVTHGRMGEELLRVAAHIMGRKLGNVQAVAVPFMAEVGDAFTGTAAPFEARRQWVIGEIRKAVMAVNTGAGVIILTDIVGGTGFNTSRSLLAPGEGIVIGGVNLPMLLKIPSIRTLPLAAAAAELVDRSRRAIEQRGPDE